jgi:hypothetical protein
MKNARLAYLQRVRGRTSKQAIREFSIAEDCPTIRAMATPHPTIFMHRIHKFCCPLWRDGVFNRNHYRSLTNHAAPTFCMKAPASEMMSAISRLRKTVNRSDRHRFGKQSASFSLRYCLSTQRFQEASRTPRLCYSFRAIEGASLLAFLFHPWKRERSPAFHDSRSPGVLRSQSGRISLVTTRRSCHRSMTDGRPQNQ